MPNQTLANLFDRKATEEAAIRSVRVRRPKYPQRERLASEARERIWRWAAQLARKEPKP